MLNTGDACRSPAPEYADMYLRHQLPLVSLKSRTTVVEEVSYGSDWRQAELARSPTGGRLVRDLARRRKVQYNPISPTEVTSVKSADPVKIERMSLDRWEPGVSAVWSRWTGLERDWQSVVVATTIVATTGALELQIPW